MKCEPKWSVHWTISMSCSVVWEKSSPLTACYFLTYLHEPRGELLQLIIGYINETTAFAGNDVDVLPKITFL